MNFFNKIVKPKKYLKAIKIFNQRNEKLFFIKNFGSIVGNQSLYKYLKMFEILTSISKINGDIIEFGIWKGNNLLFMKKTIDYLKLKKNIYGYDWFKGITEFEKYDKKVIKKKYIGNESFIKKLIKLQSLKKIKLINDDVKNFRHHFKKKKFCLVYLDLDLYKPTKNILSVIDEFISKQGLIVFDQAQKPEWVGEKKALDEFYKINKKKYQFIKLNKNFSPDIILKKIK